MVDGEVPVTVMLPVADYTRVAEAVELLGHETIAAFLASILDRVIAAGTNPVLIRHALGQSNAEISVATGLTVAQIQGRLRTAGLRPNRKAR